MHGRRRGGAYASGAAGGEHGEGAEGDEASFSLVDGGRSGLKSRGAGGGLGRGGSSLGRPGGGGRGGSMAGGGRGGAAGGGARGGAGGGGARGGRRGGGGGGGRIGWGGGRDYGRDQRVRDPSIRIGDQWTALEDIEFSRLSKLRLDVETEDVDTLAQCGFLYEYDRSYDRVHTKSEKGLQHMERLHYNPTASDDPILSGLAEDRAAKVFTTDSVLTMLMCATRSVYPWDIQITKEGERVFMDKRDEGPLDYLTVNENAADPPLEASQMDHHTQHNNPSALINTPSALSQQATFVNENFAWQVVKEDPSARHDLDRPNPFYDADEHTDLASCGYRYRRFDLSVNEDEEVDLIVRSEVDALLRGSLSTSAAAAAPTSQQNEEETLILLKSLFEFDSRAQGSGGAPDWRTKLDSQRGAVVATEMKNNSLKLARWATQGVLAGAGAMKVGYVSRAHPRDDSRHTILGTQWFKPRDLTTQMAVNLSNGWGIVRTIVDLVAKQPDGQYVLLKDPNKVRLASAPI